MISVFGATGKVGGKVAAMLLESGIPVRPLVRSAEKAAPLRNEGAEIVVGSLLDLDDVKSALDRCDGAFMMSPTNSAIDNYLEEEVAIGRNYGEALKDSSVAHVVYMSVIGARENTGLPHFESKAVVEDAIAASGVDCTFLRPAFFMENIYTQMPLIQQYGIISLPIPADVAFPMVATEDIAYAAVQSLRRGGRGKGQAYDILGPKDYSLAEVTEILSRTIGKEIRYQEMSPDEARQMFIKAGMAEKVAGDYVAMLKKFQEWYPQGDRDRLYREFNFEPTTLETVIETVAGAIRAEAGA